MRAGVVIESIRERRGLVVGWLAWAGAGLAAAIAWRWLTTTAGSAEPLCLFYRVTHVSCPTCGMTRAFSSLARGDWRAAMALHPWAIPLAFQALVAWTAWALALARPGGKRPDRWVPAAVALNAAALAVVWLVRLASGTLPSAGG